VREHVDEQESAYENMCREAATKDGHSVDQADTCEDGELKCGECPWPGKDQPTDKWIEDAAVKWIEKEYAGEDIDKWVFTRVDMEEAFKAGINHMRKHQ
jgi:hypothetical protein